MEKEKFSRPAALNKIKIEDAFWSREQELVRREVIPYQWEALNDRVPGAAPSYCMHNFRAAGLLMRKKQRQGSAYKEPVYTYRGFEVLPEDPQKPDEESFYGFVFQDSDFSKWIEAAAYSLTCCPDPELEKTADEAIDIVCAAQAENGYLDTYYIINGMGRIFTNLKDHHELYCFGHLVEGAAAYYQATGKDKLLKAAERYADFIADYFGPEEGRCKGYPGHEIAEMALARLYELTGKEKYLSLAQFFLDMRGTKPYYFDQEERERAEYENRPYTPPSPEEIRFQYYQAHLPVREQTEAFGHAVRAVYLYSGMADVARLTNDEAMYAACRRLWDSIVNEKLYVTGGIGATHLGEAFSFPYDLPNDTAYSESCAAIGLVFFARRMLEIHADSQYADVMEQALYNTVLAGMALDGKSFFYVNPLEVFPEACRLDERKRHVKTVRQKWFGCACCPPNIARLIGSLGAYAATVSEDTLYMHLYVGSRMDCRLGGKDISVRTESGFPWDGKVKVTLNVPNRPEQEQRQTIAFRIPGWCRDASFRVERSGAVLCEGKTGGSLERKEAEGGTAEADVRLEDGYLYITADWQDGDEAVLEFPMEVRVLAANTRVRANTGKAAFARGPVCYCMEEIDNGKNLHLLKADARRFSEIAVETTTWDHEMRILRVPGKRVEESPANAGLYHDYVPAQEADAVLTYVPYYAWNNRGEGEMQVWTALAEGYILE